MAQEYHQPLVLLKISSIYMIWREITVQIKAPKSSSNSDSVISMFMKIYSIDGFL